MTHRIELSTEQLGRIFRRAQADLTFRKRLLMNVASARAAVAAIAPDAIPADATIAFIARPADVDAVYVLPDLTRPVAELSDEELDAVAGGVVDITCGPTTSCVQTCCNTGLSCQGSTSTA